MSLGLHQPASFRNVQEKRRRDTAVQTYATSTPLLCLFIQHTTRLQPRHSHVSSSILILIIVRYLVMRHVPRSSIESSFVISARD